MHSSKHGNEVQQRLEPFAKHVFDNLLDKLDPEAAAEREPQPQGKDPKKQAAERSGGKKGGDARAAKLSPRKRRAIAKKATLTQWKHHQKD